MNYIRNRKKFQDGDLPDTLESLNHHIHTEDFLESEETRKEIHAALNGLPEACRRIFMMSRFEDKKYREIADELQVSVKTVETQMTKALKILREKLAKYITIILLIILFLNS